MRIFVSGMKRGIIIVAYWLAAIIFTACILMSLDYDIGHAAIMSLSFLPAAMALSFFLPKVEKTQEKKERVLGAIFIILGVMTMTFFFIYLCSCFLPLSSMGPVKPGGICLQCFGIQSLWLPFSPCSHTGISIF